MVCVTRCSNGSSGVTVWMANTGPMGVAKLKCTMPGPICCALTAAADRTATTHHTSAWPQISTRHSPSHQHVQTRVGATLMPLNFSVEDSTSCVMCLLASPSPGVHSMVQWCLKPSGRSIFTVKSPCNSSKWFASAPFSGFSCGAQTQQQQRARAHKQTRDRLTQRIKHVHRERPTASVTPPRTETPCHARKDA